MSLFAGAYTMNQGTQFVNVIGSTKDPPVRENSLNPESNSIRQVDWLTLWGRQCNGGNTSVPCIACGTRQAKVGGHVVLRGTGNNASRDANDLQGSNRVFIVPMCYVCNGQDWNSGSEKVFSAKSTIDIVQLWAFWEDSELEEEKYLLENEELFDLSRAQLEIELSDAREKHQEDLIQKCECVLDPADAAALNTASPALSSSLSWGSPMALPSGSARRSPMALPSDPSQGVPPYSTAPRLPSPRPSDFWEPDVWGANSSSYIYCDSSSEFQSDPNDSDFYYSSD